MFFGQGKNVEFIDSALKLDFVKVLYVFYQMKLYGLNLLGCN